MERDNAELSAILEALPRMQERLAELVGYYDTQWSTDHEEIDSFPSGEGSYSILSEDAIYNEIHSRLSLVQEMEHTCREILSQE